MRVRRCFCAALVWHAIFVEPFFDLRAAQMSLSSTLYWHRLTALLASLYSRLKHGGKISLRMDAVNLTGTSGYMVQGRTMASDTAEHSAVLGVESDELSRRVCAVLSRRIGTQRYAVWFGDAVHVAVVQQNTDSMTTMCVTITIGSGFSHGVLRKTFQKDLEAAAHEVCGKTARVVWQAAADSEPGHAEETSPLGGTALPAQEHTLPAQGHTQASFALGPAPSVTPTTVVTVDKNAVVTTTVVSAHKKSSRGPADVHTEGRSLGSVIAKRISPRLEEFVVGPSNRMAFAAVDLAGSRPGEMSPLVLHGPSGVGKTHLLEGICARAREQHPGMGTLFLSAEQFTTSFLQALHGSGLPGFRRTCRSAEVLLIDDLQFFIGKRATIMELQHTVDALHRQGRQMVFACDREIEALTELGPDLLTRLRGGIVARMLPPDEDVRRGIVEAIAARRGLCLPKDVVQYIAMHMTRHTRELAGAINRLEATSHMLGLPIELSMAEESLGDLVRSSGRSVRLSDIEKAVCSAFGMEPGSLQSSHRTRKVNHPRMLAMFLARKHTPSALAEIGGYFGRRSHSTVISAQKTVGQWVAKHSQIVLADSTWNVEEAIRRVEEMLRAG